MQTEYLRAMGIRQWVTRETPNGMDEAVVAVPPAGHKGSEAPGDEIPVASLDWEALQERVQTCTRCPLHETRTQTVFGTGNREADWLIIGEAPAVARTASRGDSLSHMNACRLSGGQENYSRKCCSQ